MVDQAPAQITRGQTLEIKISFTATALGDTGALLNIETPVSNASILLKGLGKWSVHANEIVPKFQKWCTFADTVTLWQPQKSFMRLIFVNRLLTIFFQALLVLVVIKSHLYNASSTLWTSISTLAMMTLPLASFTPMPTNKRLLSSEMKLLCPDSSRPTKRCLWLLLSSPLLLLLLKIPLLSLDGTTLETAMPSRWV